MVKTMLVCAPVDSPMVVPGSIFTRCCKQCKTPVMIAPSGQRVLAMQPDALVVCMYCAFQMGDNPIQFVPTDEQRAEINAATSNPCGKRVD